MVYNETGSYSTELFTKEAKEIISRHDGQKPMFLYLAHQAVHVGNGDDPLQVPEKYLKKFAGIKDHPRKKFAGEKNLNFVPFTQSSPLKGWPVAIFKPLLQNSTLLLCNRRSIV